MEKATFKVGDRVKWIHTSTGKKVSSWSIRTGTIEQIEGDIAIIRHGKETLCKVPLAELGSSSDIQVKMSKIVDSLR